MKIVIDRAKYLEVKFFGIVNGCWNPIRVCVDNATWDHEDHNN